MENKYKEDLLVIKGSVPEEVLEFRVDYVISKLSIRIDDSECSIGFITRVKYIDPKTEKTLLTMVYGIFGSKKLAIKCGDHFMNYKTHSKKI